MQKLADVKKISNPIFNITTYPSLKELLSSLEYQSTCLYVFGTLSLARSVDFKYGIPALGLDEIRNKLFPYLNSPKSEIYLKSELRKEIFRANLNRKLLYRLSDIIQTFYVFIDFNKYEINIEDDDIGKKEILHLVNFLLSLEFVKDYYERLERLSKDDISMKLCGHTQLEILFIYEMEYLNYFRLNFFHWLKKKGFAIEFKIPYDVRFPKTYSYWKEVYSVVSRQEFNSMLPKEPFQVIEKNGGKFVAFNENLSHEFIDEAKVKILEFTSPDDFKEYYVTNHNNILAVDPEDIKRVVFNGKSGLYDDEFGKFVYFMQYCSRQEEDIQLEYDTLIELLTSGWIHTPNCSGERALSLLIDLREYMEGTETLGKMLERLTLLQELEIVSKSFDRENTKDANRNHMKRYMLNPFRVLSYIQPDRHDVTITQLIDLVQELQRTCESLLLVDNQYIDVNDYFRRWLDILQRVENSESQVSWRPVFESKFPAEWEFATPELLELIFLTADSFHDNKEEIYSENRLQEYIVTKDHEKPLHLTNLTFNNFPLSHHTMLSKFFNYSELKALVTLNCNEQDELQSTLFHGLWVDYKVKEQFEELGVYQIYNLLSNYEGLVIFSWIKDLHVDSIKNVYLDILADLYQEGDLIEYKSLDNRELLISSYIQKSNLLSSELKKLYGRIPELFWLDHDFCSKKFFLTAIVDKQPIYHSDFHQQFIFSKIGKLFSQSPSDREVFRNLIYPLFPHWTYSKKENLIDMEYKINLRNYKHFENIAYPREMKGIHILRSIYRENRRTKARNQFRNKNSSNEKDLILQLSENTGVYDVKAEPGNHCKMCPHLANCTEGMYSIESLT